MITTNSPSQRAAQIKAAQTVLLQHYAAARAELARGGMFGKQLDQKARKLALRMGSHTLPEGWTIATVTPAGWGRFGYRAEDISRALADET